LLCWLKFFIVFEGDKYILARKADVLMKEVILNCFACFFFQNILMKHFVSYQESLHFMLNFRHLSIKSQIQRNDVLSHPQFEEFHQSSNGLFKTGSESSILRVADRCKLIIVLSTTKFEIYLDISILEIFITLIFNIQISSFYLQRGYCSCDC
jgi:hypothetical protein